MFPPPPPQKPLSPYPSPLSRPPRAPRRDEYLGPACFRTPYSLKWICPLSGMLMAQRAGVKKPEGLLACHPRPRAKMAPPGGALREVVPQNAPQYQPRFRRLMDDPFPGREAPHRNGPKESLGPGAFGVSGRNPTKGRAELFPGSKEPHFWFPKWRSFTVMLGEVPKENLVGLVSPKVLGSGSSRTVAIPGPSPWGIPTVMGAVRSALHAQWTALS